MVFFWAPAQEEKEDLGSMNSPALIALLDSIKKNDSIQTLLQHFVIFQNIFISSRTFDSHAPSGGQDTHYDLPFTDEETESSGINNNSD